MWHLPDIRICKNVDCQISFLVRFRLTHLSRSSHPKHSNHRALLVLVSFKMFFFQHKVLALELEASKMLNFKTSSVCLGVWSAKNDHTHITGARGLYYNISKKWDGVANKNKKTFGTDVRLLSGRLLSWLAIIHRMMTIMMKATKREDQSCSRTGQ